jgi:hypothetical protein
VQELRPRRELGTAGFRGVVAADFVQDTLRRAAPNRAARPCSADALALPFEPIFDGAMVGWRPH